MILARFSLVLDSPDTKKPFGSKIETTARTRLNQGGRAFNKEELTESTNLFLES